MVYDIPLKHRRKLHDDDDDEARYSHSPNNRPTKSILSISSGGAAPPTVPSEKGSSKKLLLKRRLSGRKEIRYAISAILWFVAAALMLSYFVTQHHRTTIIAKTTRRQGIVRLAHGFVRHNTENSNSNSRPITPKYVTVVIASVVKPDGRPQRLSAIHDTWGPGARVVLVVDNVTEYEHAPHAGIWQRHGNNNWTTPADRNVFPQVLLMPTSDQPSNGLARLQFVQRAVYEQLNPDFAFFVNDHTFVVAEHVCKFVENYDPTVDLYAGHALKNNERSVFNSGAAGYVLSRRTLQRLVQQFDAQDDVCAPSQVSTWLQSNPGVAMADCLAQRLHVRPIDTRSRNHGHRFHAFPIVREVTGDLDEWYHNKHKNMSSIMMAAAAQQQSAASSSTHVHVSVPQPFDASYNVLSAGPACCASDTVSFHYVEWREARALFAVHEALLTDPTMSDVELGHLVRAEWPYANHVGAYSRPLPKSDDTTHWHDLLATLRKLSTRKTQREC